MPQTRTLLFPSLFLTLSLSFQKQLQEARGEQDGAEQSQRDMTQTLTPLKQAASQTAAFMARFLSGTVFGAGQERVGPSCSGHGIRPGVLRTTLKQPQVRVLASLVSGFSSPPLEVKVPCKGCTNDYGLLSLLRQSLFLSLSANKQPETN